MSDYDEIDDEAWDEEPDVLDGDEEFDCQMTRDGSCGAAGSEECEFVCPYRAEQRAMERRRG